MTSNLLTDNELKALIAMVEVGQEGPVEIVFDANMAITKLQRVDDATLAQEFANELQPEDREILKTKSDDFISGVLYRWMQATLDCCGNWTYEDAWKKTVDASPFIRSYL